MIESFSKSSTKQQFQLKATRVWIYFLFLYVPRIYQNLLSVSQLLDRERLQDLNSMEVIKVQMKGKSFALNLMQEELTIDEEDKKE